MSLLHKIRVYYNDPEYFHNIQKLAWPIIIQQFMFSGLNMLGVVFVGQKGETAVAAVGLASPLALLLKLRPFVPITGGAILYNHFSCKKEIANLPLRFRLCFIFAKSASLLLLWPAEL